VVVVEQSKPYIKEGFEIVVQGSSKPQKLDKNVRNVKNLPSYWDAEYIRQTIKQTTPGMHKVLYQTMWMTGIRITEALNIRKKDIDLKNHTITVRWQKNRRYKTRNVACHPNLNSILEVYTAGMNQEDKLFPITRQRAWQLYQRDFKGKPHQMRHSFAVHWLRNGQSLAMLSRHLGHSRIQTTMIYLQIVPLDVGKQLLEVDF
jgi:integrase